MPYHDLQLLNNLISALSNGRGCMVIPKRKTIDDLRRSINVVSTPAPLHSPPCSSSLLPLLYPLPLQ